MERVMRTIKLALAVAGLTVLAAGAGGQDAAVDNSLDLTMKLLPEGAASPEAITKTIVLPPAASATGVANSENGRARANEARETGRENAAEARERGRELGQEIAEQARENRDNAGRGNAPDRPDRPDRPDQQNPPGPP
jgi:hypothetical protein